MSSKPKQKAKNQKSRKASGPRRQPKSGQVSVAPANVNVHTVTTAPQITSKAGRVTVRHTEYVAEIGSTTLPYLLANTIAIQPGLSHSFAWLSNIANNYESYVIKKLEFEFRPARSTATDGRVWMAIDTDAADSGPNNKVDMASYAHSVSGSIWERLVMKYPTGEFGAYGRWFTRAGDVANTDIKTYDAGKLYVGIGGIGGAPGTIGELYVSYVIEFYTPQKGINMDRKVAELFSDPNPPLAQPFSIYQSLHNYIFDVDNTDPTKSKITFTEPGNYVVNVFGTGTGVTGTPVTTGSTVTTGILSAITSSTEFNYAMSVVAAAGSVLALTMTGRASSLTKIRALFAPSSDVVFTA